VIRIEIFISGGGEIDALRDVAADALRRLEHMFFHELRVELSIGNWDFRVDSPRIVPSGQLATRSLQMVDLSHAAVAIFGSECPHVTTQEIHHCFELRRDGARVEVFVFVNPELRTDEHDAFFRSIDDEFGEQIVWAPYRTELELQAGVLTALTPYLLRHLGIVTSPPAASAA
jgi:hypothetical protein